MTVDKTCSRFWLASEERWREFPFVWNATDRDDDTFYSKNVYLDNFFFSRARAAHIFRPERQHVFNVLLKSDDNCHWI